MRAPVHRRVCALTTLMAGLAGVAVLAAQDRERPVNVIDASPAPIRIESSTFFLFDGMVTTAVRNLHTAPVRITLRAWVFDHAGRLKGTNAFCAGELLDRSTRRVISTRLEVRDLASTDSVTVGVERVDSERRQWTMADSAETGVRVARQRSVGTGGRLRLEDRPADGWPAVACPCECQSTAVSCEAHCFDRGIGAFTCSPVGGDGCSASCSCK